MERTGHKKFKPQICAACGQTTEYPIRLDKGSALIVIAVSRAIRRKNQNRVHLFNEMLCKRGEYRNAYEAALDGKMSARAAGNALRPKYHGLIAQVEGGGKGEYLLTPKGAQFLRGMAVPAIAVIDKTKHKKKEYLDGETETATISRILRSDTPFWDLEWEIDEQSLALKRKVEAARTAAPQASLL